MSIDIPITPNQVDFVFPNMPAGVSSGSRGSSSSGVSSMPAESVDKRFESAPGVVEMMSEEVANLRKTYNDLVTFTVRRKGREEVGPRQTERCGRVGGCGGSRGRYLKGPRGSPRLMISD